MLNRVLENLANQESQISLEKRWEKIRKKFTVLWIADGSTLEKLRKRLKVKEENTEKASSLAGKIMMIVEVFTQNPVTVWYHENEKAHDQNWWEQITSKLPVGGLIILDLGFFNFTYFDILTESNKYFLTRLKAKTNYQVTRVLSQGTYYKDEIIKMGNYRSNPCKHSVRLVSVLWEKNWYYYVTNVLDEQQLSPQEVCELYRRRWRIEDAFLLTKRLLGLSYLWVGHSNGVQSSNSTCSNFNFLYDFKSISLCGRNYFK